MLYHLESPEYVLASLTNHHTKDSPILAMDFQSHSTKVYAQWLEYIYIIYTIRPHIRNIEIPHMVAASHKNMR